MFVNSFSTNFEVVVYFEELSKRAEFPFIIPNHNAGVNRKIQQKAEERGEQKRPEGKKKRMKKMERLGEKNGPRKRRVPNRQTERV